MVDKAKAKDEKEVPALCVCGAEPCLVNHKKRHAVCCPKIQTCSLRSRLWTNEQLAIKDWNAVVKSNL